MAVLFGAMMLRSIPGRVALLFAAVVVAVLVNGLRVFLTGFLVFFVSPALGAGFMHTTEGWLLFLVSLSVLAGITWMVSTSERWFRRWRTVNA
jgi:exosortase/archaeosortase family protein